MSLKPEVQLAAVGTAAVAIPITSGVVYYKKFANKKTKHRGLKAVGVGLAASILASPAISFLMLGGLKDMADETQKQQEEQNRLFQMKQKSAHNF